MIPWRRKSDFFVSSLSLSLSLCHLGLACIGNENSRFPTRNRSLSPVSGLSCSPLNVTGNWEGSYINFRCDLAVTDKVATPQGKVNRVQYSERAPKIQIPA